MAGALLVGTFLRLHQITAQIIADDEWHAVQYAAHESYRYLASHFGLADYSIPLAVFYKVALDTFGLSEMAMRAPVLLFGLAALVAFPRLVRDNVGRHAASVFALLIALSPLHVYFSRYARPYSASVFFAFTATVAFYKWWSGAGRRWSHLYAVCAGLGALFHLTAVPVTLAPIAFGAAALAAARSRVRTMKELVLVAVEAVLVGGILLSAALATDHAALSAKAGGALPDAATAMGAAQLLGGSRHGWLLLVLALACLHGGVLLGRGRPGLLAYALTLTATQAAAVVALRPALVNVPIVLARYLLPVLPWLLLITASGIAGFMLALKRLHTALAFAFLITVAAILWTQGPLPTTYYRPNNWTNHAMFQYSYARPACPPATALRISPFYLELAKQPSASVTVLEAPWYLDWGSNVYPCYQQVHRQWMAIGFVRDVETGEMPQPMFNELRPALAASFRNFVHVRDHEGIAARDVGYVIFHRNLDRELPTVMRRPHASVLPWIAEYRRVYGSPIYADESIVVFATRRPPSPR